MAAPVLKMGAASGVTGVRKASGDGTSLSVEVEGSYSALDALTDAQLDALLPAGYWTDSRRLEPAGGGMGRLTLTARAYDDPGAQTPAAPVRTTFRVEMEEVDYDLEDHPALAAGRGVILKWLASDEAGRAPGDGTYRYMDADGGWVDITGEDTEALRFIAAHMAGIRTFRRFFPVVERVSTYRNPPGLSRSGRSFTGGQPPFSAGLGTFGDPPISLAGYPAGNWFKSRDSWQEGAGRAWTRTEQWTYTPEGASSAHAWIYAAAAAGEEGGE